MEPHLGAPDESNVVRWGTRKYALWTNASSGAGHDLNKDIARAFDQGLAPITELFDATGYKINVPRGALESWTSIAR